MPDQKAQGGKLCIDETPRLPEQRAFASCGNRKLSAPVVDLFAGAARAALSTCVCSSSVSLKLTDLVRFASLISLSFRMHSVHTPACTVCTLPHAAVWLRIRVNHRKGWTKPMYTRSADTTATRAGVSCLFLIRCEAPRCFVRSLKIWA